MSQTDLCIDNVSVRYSLRGRTFIALDSVSLEVDEGETVCLVGPSGCGKTTLLNVVAGFLLPTNGEVRVGGTPVAGPGPDRAVVFQADAVFPWLSVRRNLEYGPRIRGMLDANATARVDSYLEMMGLTAFANEFPKVLSGGMRKRVDVARVYANDPQVVLLDEPFGALDDFTKSHLQDELIRLSLVNPKTTMFVTHDIEEALYVGNRVAVMSARPGRIEDIIAIPFPRDRTSSVKDADEFHQLRQYVQRLLRKALTRAMQVEEQEVVTR